MLVGLGFDSSSEDSESGSESKSGSVDDVEDCGSCVTFCGVFTCDFETERVDFCSSKSPQSLKRVSLRFSRTSGFVRRL